MTICPCCGGDAGASCHATIKMEAVLAPTPSPLAPEARSLKDRISKEEFRRGVNAAAEKLDATDSADHARAQAEAESPPSSRSEERPATGRCPVCQAPAPCPNGCDWGGRGEGVLP